MNGSNNKGGLNSGRPSNITLQGEKSNEHRERREHHEHIEQHG